MTVQTLEWFTVPEAATRWRVSEDTVLRMIRDKTILAKKFGRQWRIHQSVIDAFEYGGKARKTPSRPDVVLRHGDPLGIYQEPAAGRGR